MIPSKLKIKNFFSHKDSEVDFSEFNSALLIGNTEGDYSKSNGSGKSAIFEAILWCLFNKSRASMMDDIIRWGEKTCSVDLEFTHNDKKYMVSRVRNRINSTSSVELFVMNNDGGWENISCSTSGDTNLRIESTIKLDYKTFINSVYFRQNDISEFAESEPSKKKEILKSIVDISRWDEYEKAARKKSKDIKLECKILKSSIEDYDNIVERLASVSSQMSDAEKSSATLKSNLLSLNDEIVSLDQKYSLIKKSLDTDTYDKIIIDLKDLERESESLKKAIESSSASLSKAIEGSEKLKADHKDVAAHLEGRIFSEVEDDQIHAKRDELVQLKAKRATASEVLRSMGETELLVGECHVCNQPISEQLYDKIKCEHKEREDLYNKLFAEANQGAMRVEEEIQSLVAEQKESKKTKELMSKKESLEYKLNLLSASIDKDSNSLRLIEDEYAQVLFKIKNNTEILQSIKNEDFQSLRLKLKNLKKDREDTKNLISEQDKKLGMLSERHSVLSERERKMRRDKKKISKKLKRASLFDKLGKMFGKGGIQTILLDFVIEDLETTANGILSSICNEPSVIVLETQRLGADGVSIIETLDLKVRKDGHLQNFKSLSGGEKFRISLALRVALSDISSRYGGSSLEFLLLDEVNSPLDRYGVETLFVSVIKSLEDRYKILVITHDESLKEKFDNVINITKVNGDSELEFTKR